MLTANEFDLLQMIYYSINTRPWCLNWFSRPKTVTTLVEAGYARESVDKLVERFLKRDLPLGEVMAARYNWVAEFHNISPQATAIVTTNGTINVMFGTKRNVKKFIGGGALHLLHGTPNLKRPITAKAKHVIDPYLYKAGIGINLEGLYKRFHKGVGSK